MAIPDKAGSGEEYCLIITIGLGGGEAKDSVRGMENGHLSNGKGVASPPPRSHSHCASCAHPTLPGGQSATGWDGQAQGGNSNSVTLMESPGALLNSQLSQTLDHH